METFIDLSKSCHLTFFLKKFCMLENLKGGCDYGKIQFSFKRNRGI